MDKFKNERIALTLGDAGENHTGMELLGNFGSEGSGFTTNELKNLKCHFENSEYISFKINENDAGVLIIRNYISENDQLLMYKELKKLEWNKKYFDIRRNKVLNKHARYNLMFIEGMEQVADYKNKKGTIIDSNKLKYFKKFKNDLCKKINEYCNNKASDLIVEGNLYYDVTKCGIGFHGDSERRKVICLSLGADNYPIKWQWFYKNTIVGNSYEIFLNSGDVYIMSELAVGTNWKKSSIYTMRHAAGSNKYTSLAKYQK